jgi:glycosyltransferase involved in cell wall biosynthesis
VEEPVIADVDEPVVTWTDSGSITVVQLHVPSDAQHLGHDSAEAARLAAVVAEAAGDCRPVAWLYTPLALPAARLLDPSVLVYDVMDDLASFKGASPLLRARQREALRDADVVFTGGRSLHAGVAAVRPDRTFLFPSGVETEHYEPARHRRRRRERPVAGYVGVIDERLDLDLLADLADRLPGWDLRIVGPVAKIDPASLPDRPNLHFPGPATYAELPDVMAGFDVALMPFALNEATRSISPTKTLEYLAAGLPVASTRVPDVVSDYGHVVALCDDAAGFAEACEEALAGVDAEWWSRCKPVLDWHHWDRIAGRMAAILDRHVVGAGRVATTSMERSA